MKLRERAEEIFAWGMKQRTENFPDANNSAWENHSRAAAEIAEKIAKHAGMDAERAYAGGLLHDIGRYLGPHTGMNHIPDGYDLLKEKGMPEEVARVCLTHSFNPQETVEALELENKEREQFVKNYVLNTKYDDYDKLFQLVDFMSGSHGVTTIERRFCSVIYRHDIPDPRSTLIKIYEIKKYFDKKIGGDIYELFHDKIAETPFQGIPGGGALIEKKGERK
ncbi:HD domain-containing protein [Candidatus Saccharibacteria bacterium]|nr:HD domain-containing protein [Candidatus Saccharibacteria bacterium]